MVTIAPVHDHTRHQECEYTYTNQTHVIVQFSILNCSVSYYRHSCIERCFQMCPLSRPKLKCQSVFCFIAKCSNNVALRLSTRFCMSFLALAVSLYMNVKFSQDKLKNSQLHRNMDHFLRFRDIRDQVFKKGTLGDLRAKWQP